MSVWSGKRVAEYVGDDSEYSIEPNGVEIGIDKVEYIPSYACAIFDGDDRRFSRDSLSEIFPINGLYKLIRGTYRVRLSNKITIPSDAIGLMYPRSSLLRFGVIKSQTAIWDSGYSGYGIQTIFLNNVLRISEDEKWFQLIFIDSDDDGSMYDGYWQNEGVEDK